ncbi:hypothetical protein A5658_04315 [Mycobacterium sp. 1245111.1]|uniref:hypothetical protein n=1 Tax=Mycobacterium sp. 1245111.1 TaxID=1834073 RepID=UPI0007FD9CE1|nr:hypothetical protein [Mycobacterium sp. 1245111.1]OBK37187.1 hypothetical protein A5658_04315 [Mycobacterium sp. 1245111.1]
MVVRVAVHGGPAAAAQQVVDCLDAQLYAWADERELQDQVAQRLASAFPVQREKSISQRDRPDFLVTAGDLVVAVEVKVAGARNTVLRQLGRYAAHDAVTAVVLASGRRTLLAGVPTMIHGKPIAVALLAGGL